MRMSIRAVSVLDIASATGKTINHLPWKLLQGKFLREHYDWPRDPPSFTATQKKLWKIALTKAFIQPHSTQTHRKLNQPVTIWQSLSPLKDWLYFYSAASKDRLYRKHNNNSWKIYTYHGGAIRNRRYKFTNLTCTTKTPAATLPWLTSVSPHLAPTNNPDHLVVAGNRMSYPMAIQTS
jgi:hypothetical protein